MPNRMIPTLIISLLILTACTAPAAGPLPTPQSASPQPENIEAGLQFIEFYSPF